MALTYAVRYPISLTVLNGEQIEKALPLGKVRIYIAGTSTLATVYTDRTKGTTARIRW
jgi:hypothetical protein